MVLYVSMTHVLQCNSRFLYTLYFNITIVYSTWCEYLLN